MSQQVALELKGVTKTFGSVVANRDVDLTLYSGEILAILGENGSGKTTLMNMIAGLYFPDKGQVFVGEKEVFIRSPKDAFAQKIGMVHQHFKLIDVFSAAENIMLGMKKKDMPSFAKTAPENATKKEKTNIFKKIFGWLKTPNWMTTIEDSVQQIVDKYGFHLDVKKKVHEMSVSEKQTVEIIKVLYRGADILILDEPTAVLTPQETEKLFTVLRRMREDGKSIIIITHKLHEVLSLSDRVAVLRKGEYIDTVQTIETSETELTEMMVGKKITLNIERSVPNNVCDRLTLSHISSTNHEGQVVLDDISFTARSGEILGIAGISGSGQRELLEAIAGLYPLQNGEISYLHPKTEEQINLRDKTPLQIREMGVRLSFVPEDRLGMGLVGNMDIVDNMMLRSYRKGKSIFLNRKRPKTLANDIIDSLQVVTPGDSTPVRRLSGGNVQKVLVGREIASSPTVLMAAYPVRGLDINSSYTIYNLLTKQKEKGVAVIFVGEDLDVLVELCDRILVVNAGKITGSVDGRTTTKEEIGFLMTKQKENGGEEHGENA